VPDVETAKALDKDTINDTGSEAEFNQFMESIHAPGPMPDMSSSAVVKSVN
jgi:hypothetical protein